MDLDRYARVKRCFAAAQALPEAERAAYVERASEGDAELGAEVHALLAAAARDSALDGLLDEPSPRGGHPARIGAYRILGIAGRGGMGTVYEAEQEQPRRRVALKVVDPGRLGPGVLRRFELEAEVLGRLQHPGLARIFAAGTFDDGAGPQPYFAMEFVRGRELVEYANAAELDVAARLRLLTRVAEAVSHAHSQGVVHRDLKPSNILVDETGQPKILDFGVARVTDEDAPRVTLQTSAGQLVGTLPYMSPEQAAGDPERVDERADVYALGVLMHELLTGELPLPMRGLSVQEAVRSLQEDDPAPLASHDRSLRGDVETIVSKALAKEPERRYLSADDLVEDIRRYLAHEPIVARPPTVLYQLGKFTRRHKGLVVGVGAGLAIAFGALALALVVSLRTSDELARSEARALRQSDRSAIAAAAAALELDEVARARRQLERVPPERRGWEWDYYTAQLDTSFALFDVGAPIAALAFDAEGETLVLADATGRIRRWDPQRREVVAEVALGRALPTPAREAFVPPVECVLDATGSRLAVLGPETVQVFDARSGAVLAERELPGGPGAPGEPGDLWELAIDPQGRRVAVTGASGLWSWELATDALALLDPTPFTRLDFAEDGLLFALQPGPQVHAAAVFDVERGVQLWELSEWQRTFGTELANGGRELFVARADDKKAVRRLDVEGRETAYLEHSLPPRAIAWSEASGLLASGADDHVVCIWDPEVTAAPLAELHGHAGPIERLRFDPTGRRVAATAGTVVRVWDLDAPSGSLVLEHPAPVYTADYLADGTLLSSDWRGLFRRWSPAGELLSEVQDVAAGSRLTYSADERWFARQRWHHLALLDSELGEVTELEMEQQLKLTDVSLSADGALVATRNPKALYVARTPDLELVFHRPLDERTRPLDNRFGAVLLDRAGERLFAQDESGDLVVWELPSGRELTRLSGQGGLISRLATAPDESLLACGSTDGTTWVWDLERYAVVARLERHASRVYALAFTRDLRRLATGSDDTTVRLWDLRDQVETAVFSAHTDYVYDLAFSADGKQLASASGDGTVRVWDTVARSAR